MIWLVVGMLLGIAFLSGAGTWMAAVDRGGIGVFGMAAVAIAAMALAVWLAAGGRIGGAL